MKFCILLVGLVFSSVTFVAQATSSPASVCGSDPKATTCSQSISLASKSGKSVNNPITKWYPVPKASTSKDVKPQ